jgi:hypothetical protein
VARVRQNVLAWLAERDPSVVDERLLDGLRAAFPKASERILHHALLESGRRLAPLVEGVNQHSFDDLERTLITLADEYAASDPERRKRIRALVITARTHASFVARGAKVAGEKRSEKLEMGLWMMTWLENPPLFPIWVRLRRREAAGSQR